MYRPNEMKSDINMIKNMFRFGGWSKYTIPAVALAFTVKNLAGLKFSSPNWQTYYRLKKLAISKNLANERDFRSVV